MLGNAGKQVFDKLAVWITAKLDRRAFQLPAGGFNGSPQMRMGYDPACQAADVVDDDDMLYVLLGKEIQKLGCARTLDQLAGDPFIAKRLHNLIPTPLGIFSAPGFLGF